MDRIEDNLGNRVQCEDCRILIKNYQKLLVIIKKMLTELEKQDKDIKNLKGIFNNKLFPTGGNI